MNGNHTVEFVSENLQFCLVWAFCDLLVVKVVSLCDSHVDEAKWWISLCNSFNPFTLNGCKGSCKWKHLVSLDISNKVNVTLLILEKMSQVGLFQGMQSLHCRKIRTGKPSESDPSGNEGQAQADEIGSSAAPVFKQQHGAHRFLANFPSNFY